MDGQQQYLTVKQFAERAGVSTQRIYQLLTKSLQEFTKTENGTKYISVEGLRFFDKEPLQEVAKDLQSDLQESATPETELLKETIEALRQQLTVKDEQLAAKDKQIGDLTAALLSGTAQGSDRRSDCRPSSPRRHDTRAIDGTGRQLRGAV